MTVSSGSEFPATTFKALAVFKRPKAVDLKTLSPAARKAREAAIEQSQVVTGRISETTRSLAFGSLASCYALLLANKDLAVDFEPVRSQLLLSGTAGILAVILDAAQYVFGYINVQKALQSQDQLYPYDWSRILRTYCFRAKQLFAYAAALLLLGAIASRLL